MPESATALVVGAGPVGLTMAGELIRDPEGHLHDRYGAGDSDDLYLIRPDGHVAYRSQPADAAKLVAYLDRTITSIEDARVKT